MAELLTNPKKNVTSLVEKVPVHLFFLLELEENHS